MFGTTVERLPSRDALHRCLSLHPAGTSFTWSESPSYGRPEDTWMPGEAAQLMEDTRTLIERRGMHLTYKRMW